VVGSHHRSTDQYWFRCAADLRGPEFLALAKGVLSVTLAGIGGVIVLGSLMLMFIFNSTINTNFGVTARLSLSFMIGVIVVGIIWYVAAYFLNRSQGVDVSLAYREIPPE
jgi:hypothetical protein